MQVIRKYFPNLSAEQDRQFNQLMPLFRYWNQHINLISRNDIENLYERHVLHSLSIARVCSFAEGSEILDLGTGGGFPGIPLAIMFPNVQFHLVDSIGKKINVVGKIVKDLGLQNVTFEQARAESLVGAYDFVLARAVSNVNNLLDWTQYLISDRTASDLPNGLLLLKGGDLTKELNEMDANHYLFPIRDFFDELYFDAKYVVYVFK
jgi:16S rRNA (guanine527-N7)-methyltransferase